MTEIDYVIRDRFGTKVGRQKAVDSSQAVDLFCQRTSQMAAVHGLYAELPATLRPLGPQIAKGAPPAVGQAKAAF